MEIALFATCAFFSVDVSGFFEAALLLICLNVHTLLFEVCDGGVRGAGTSSTARTPQSVASPGGFCVLNAGSMISVRIVFVFCAQAKAADPAKARELLASAQQAREQAESEVAKIDESIRRSEVHRHG